MATPSVASERIAPGIRIRTKGKRRKYDAYVKVGRKSLHKYFPLETPIAKIQQWQRQSRASMFSEKLMLEPRPIPVLPVAPDGWCYLYVFQRGLHIKIGRSVNVRSRLQQLQSASPETIDYILSVPIHASFEEVVHTYFAPLRTVGEWYMPNDEMRAFIDFLKSDLNPLHWFWYQSTYLKTVPVAEKRSKQPNRSIRWNG